MIYIRIFILDINVNKHIKMLEGDTVQQQFKYYYKHFWNNENYKKILLEKYSEFERLSKLVENQKLQYMKQITRNFMAEKDSIKEKYHFNLNCFWIKKIELGKGDIHRIGHNAAKVILSNNEKIYYKSYISTKHLKYKNVCTYLFENLNYSYKKIKYLSRSNYGWEENIENESCKTGEEIKRYYYRMGIHLFLAYSLGATDLHGENIIAHGEYPVIIDMETYPGFIPHFDRSSTKDKAETSLRERIVTSVMRTGMLPVLTWGRGNNRVLISAMNMNGKIRTPFKVPVVKDDKTSNIHIEYEQVEFEMEECIVRLNGEAVNSAEYTEYLVQGFQAAYLEMMKDEKIKAMLEKFYYGKCICLHPFIRIIWTAGNSVRNCCRLCTKMEKLSFRRNSGIMKSKVC